MTYYILLEGESKELLMYDYCTLGELTSNGKKFYANAGFGRLLRISKDTPEMLEKVEIYNDENKHLTIEQFLRILSTCKVEQITNNQ